MRKILLIYIHKAPLLLHTVLFWRAWKQSKEKPSSEAPLRARISSHLLVNNPGNKFGPAAAALLKYISLPVWRRGCCCGSSSAAYCWTELLQNPLLGLNPDLFPPCFCRAVGRVVWSSALWEPAAGIVQPSLVEHATMNYYFLIWIQLCLQDQWEFGGSKAYCVFFFLSNLDHQVNQYS